MTFVPGLCFPPAGAAGGWDTRVGRLAGPPLVSSMPRIDGVAGGAAAGADRSPAVRGLAEPSWGVDMSVQTGAGDSCQGGVLKDAKISVPLGVSAAVDEPAFLQQEIARVSSVLVAMNELKDKTETGAALFEELGRRLVLLR